MQDCGHTIRGHSQLHMQTLPLGQAVRLGLVSLAPGTSEQLLFWLCKVDDQGCNQLCVLHF